MHDQYDVIVVGAGYAGIHAAAELERMSPDSRVLVLEASDRVGGRAWTRPAEPDQRPAVDMGAHYFAVYHRRIWTLALRLLGNHAIYSHIPNFGADPSFRTLVDGEWRSTTRSSTFFNIPGLSRQAPLIDRIRIFESLTQYLALEALVDVREPWRTPLAERLDRVTVAEWIAGQRMPKWIDDQWDLACIGLLSAAPEQLSLLYWLWYNLSNGGFLLTVNDFTGGPQEFGLRGGFGGLLRRYAASLRGGVRLDAPVIEIDHGDAREVRVTLAGGEQLSARRVVVAVSPATAGRTIEFVPELGEARRRLHQQPMGHACKAVIRYPTPWWRDSHGHHFIGYGGGAGSRGAEWALDASDPDDGHHTLMVFLHPALIRGAGPDRGRIEARVAEEVVRMSGDPRAREFEAIDVFDWTAEPFIGGGPNTLMGRGVLSQLGPVFRRPEPPHERLYFTAAEYANEYCGYVEGALEAGEFTAAQVGRDLQIEHGRSAAPLLEARATRPRLLRALVLAIGFVLLALAARVVALFDRRRGP
ncbi:MAG TPA: FAD-dependent oxidoreductase [Enhygromyxa sp.]|nr:FAD-dependent oxidoreductase [Enhygromyxa sp.]